MFSSASRRLNRAYYSCALIVQRIIIGCVYTSQLLIRKQNKLSWHQCFLTQFVLFISVYLFPFQNHLVVLWALHFLLSKNIASMSRSNESIISNEKVSYWDTDQIRSYEIFPFSQYLLSKYHNRKGNPISFPPSDHIIHIWLSCWVRVTLPLVGPIQSFSHYEAQCMNKTNWISILQPVGCHFGKKDQYNWSCCCAFYLLHLFNLLLSPRSSRQCTCSY